MGGDEARGSRLLRGILDACLLALVVERDRYGYELATALHEAGLPIVKEGSIYPLLSRLERRGLLASYRTPAAGGPPRRYYRITTDGRNDLAAFASEWAQAERPRPLLDVFLQFVAAVTLLPGGFALLNPWLTARFGEQDPRIGLPIGTLASLALVVPVFTGWQLVRVLRHRLTTQQTALVGLLLFVGYFVLASLVGVPDRASTGFVAVSPATAWTLVAIGLASQGTASWLKRRR